MQAAENTQTKEFIKCTGSLVSLFNHSFNIKDFPTVLFNLVYSILDYIHSNITIFCVAYF